MRKVKMFEKAAYILVVLVIVVAVSMLCSVQAKSRSRAAVLFDNGAYETAEQEYQKQVRDILESYGIYHSGLTMTRVVSLEGEREYTILIYNDNLSDLEKESYTDLFHEISKCRVSAPDGNMLPVEVILTGYIH